MSFWWHRLTASCKGTVLYRQKPAVWREIFTFLKIFDLVGYLRPLHIYATVEPAGLNSIQHTEQW